MTAYLIRSDLFLKIQIIGYIKSHTTVKIFQVKHTFQYKFQTEFKQELVYGDIK